MNTQARSMWIVAVVLATFSGCSKATKATGQPCKTGECKSGLVCRGRTAKTCLPCTATTECTQDGRCTYQDGMCRVTSDKDCLASAGCKTDLLCKMGDGACVDNSGARRGENEQLEGCPCGCDRSEALVASLAQLPPADGLVGAQRSIRTIEQREDAGYITEAMVSHRLRLRALERSLLAGATRDTAIQVPTWPIRSPVWADASNSSLSLRSDLLVFGETTETVNGQAKDLPPCFSLRLTLENSTKQRRVLPLPKLTSSVSFQVKRWYVQGTDGEHWDGTLDANQTRSVVVVGYIDGELEPGTRLSVSTKVGEVSVVTSLRALDHWDGAVNSPRERRQSL